MTHCSLLTPSMLMLAAIASSAVPAIKRRKRVTYSLWGISSSCSTEEGTAVRRASRASRGTARPIPVGLRQRGAPNHEIRVGSSYWRRLDWRDKPGPARSAHALMSERRTLNAERRTIDPPVPRRLPSARQNTPDKPRWSNHSILPPKQQLQRRWIWWYRHRSGLLRCRIKINHVCKWTVSRYSQIMPT